MSTATTALGGAIHVCARSLALEPRWILVAAVDLPYGTVRLGLTDDQLTEHDEDTVELAARAIIDAARVHRPT